MSLSLTLRFQHVMRDGNDCADWLAKHGAVADHDFLIWNSCPHQLSFVLLADAMGVVNLRS